MAGNIYHEWDGTRLIVTSDSGTSSCDLKGEQGDIGIRGPQGSPGVIVANEQIEASFEEVNAKVAEVSAKVEETNTKVEETNAKATELENNKLDKFTVENKAGDKVYVARYDGTQTTTFIGARPGYIARYNGSAENNSEPSTNCALVVSTPQSDYSAANKKYVDDELLEKLDKNGSASEYGTVYGVSETGEQIQINLGHQPLAGRIPRFDENNRIQTNTPENELECANKYYVDTVADTKLDAIKSGGNYRMYGINHDGAQRVFTTGYTMSWGHIPWYFTPGECSADSYGNKNTTLVIPGTPVGPYDAANKKYVDNTSKIYRHSISLFYNVSSTVTTGVRLIECYFTFLSRSSEAVTKENFFTAPTSYMDILGIVLVDDAYCTLATYNTGNHYIRYVKGGLPQFVLTQDMLDNASAFNDHVLEI